MSVNIVIGQQLRLAQFFVKKPGALFVPPVASWILVAGVWRPIIMNPFTLTVLTSHGANWNAYTAFVQKYGVAPPPGAKIDITVPAGQVMVGRSTDRNSGPRAAISTAGLPTNCQVTLHVYGTVLGSAGSPGMPGNTFPAMIMEGQNEVFPLASAALRDSQPDRMLIAGNGGERPAFYPFDGSGWVTDKSRFKLRYSERPDGRNGGPAIESSFPITVKVYPGHAIYGGGGGGGGIGHARIVHCLGTPFYSEWQFVPAPVTSYTITNKAWSSGATFVPFSHDNFANTYTWGAETLFVGVPGTFGAGGLPLDASTAVTSSSDLYGASVYCHGVPPYETTKSQIEGATGYAGITSLRYLAPNAASVNPPAGYRHGQALRLLYLGENAYTAQYTYGDVSKLKIADGSLLAFAGAVQNGWLSAPLAEAVGYDYAARLFLNTIAKPENYADSLSGKGSGGVYGYFRGPSGRTLLTPGAAERSVAFVESTSDSKRVSARYRIYGGKGGTWGAAGREQSAKIFGYTGALGNGVLQQLDEAKHKTAQDHPDISIMSLVGYGKQADFQHGTVLRPMLSGKLVDLSSVMVEGYPLPTLDTLRSYLMGHAVSNGLSSEANLPIPKVPYYPRYASRTFNMSGGLFPSTVVVDMSAVTTKLAGVVLNDEFLAARQVFSFTAGESGVAAYPHPQVDSSLYTGATPALPVQPCYMGKPGNPGKAIACTGVIVDTSAAPLNALGAVG